MKILFASDMSFNYFEGVPADEKIAEMMKEASDCFAKADFSVLNLETVFGERKDEDAIIKDGPNLICDKSFVKFLAALKPTAAGLANNHTGDYGEEPIFNTLKILEDNNIKPFGAGKNIEEAYKSVVFEKDGEKVAIIGVCENEFGIATKTNAGAAGLKISLVTKAIKEAKEKGQKPVIYFHGGTEYLPFPSPRKKELYRLFIDLGAEAVIAMHTHCPQGFEMYNGKPICYSMGNFYFPSNVLARYKSWFYGYMCVLTLEMGKWGFEYIPYTFDFEGIRLLKGDEKAHFDKYMQYICEPIDDDDKLQEYFDIWCARSKGFFAYVANLLRTNMDAIADGKQAEIKQAKNCMSCEAHNELITNTMNMVYFNRIEEAKAKENIIYTLQDMVIPGV